MQCLDAAVVRNKEETIMDGSPQSNLPPPFTHQGNHQQCETDNSSTKLRKLKLIYYVLLLFRVAIAPTISGYIHPDEFFQGGQELFYGCSGSRKSTDGTSTKVKNDSTNNDNKDQNRDVLMISSSINDDPHQRIEHYTLLYRYHKNYQQHKQTQKYQASDYSSTLFYDWFFQQMDHITATWEYQHHHAIRSIVPPFFMTLLPLQTFYLPMRNYYLYYKNIPLKSTIDNSHHGTNHHDFNGREIWIVPRLFMALLSILVVDYTIWCILPYTMMIGIDNDAEMNKSQLDYETNMMQVMIIFATSWTSLLFLNRPFSNTLETMLLALLLLIVIHDIVIIHTTGGHSSIKNNTMTMMKMFGRYVSIGIICSLGLFTRFTYAIFAFPIVLVYLHEKSITNMKKKSMTLEKFQTQLDDDSDDESHLTITWGTTIQCYLREFFTISFLILFGFMITCYEIILLDSEFYALQRQQQQHEQEGAQIKQELQHWINDIVITPWNAFRYNSQTSNLSDHGIHPRLTHFAVNLPMLFGPLAIYFYISMSQSLITIAKKGVWSSLSIFFMGERNRDKDTAYDTDIVKPKEEKQLLLLQQKGSIQIRCVIYRMCYGMIVIGLLILSCAPHQEPRFLLPLIVPLILLHAKDILQSQEQLDEQGRGKDGQNKHINDIVNASPYQMNWRMIVTWIAFNIVLLLFFGIMHQAAVIPSILKLPSSISLKTDSIARKRDNSDVLPKAIITFHTYMPPTFLLRQGTMNGSININSINQDSLGHENSIETTTCLNNDKDVCPSINIDDDINNEGIGQRKSLNDVCNNVPLVDMKGSNVEKLITTIESILQCHERRNNEDGDNHYLYLVAPQVSIVNIDIVIRQRKKYDKQRGGRDKQKGNGIPSNLKRQLLWRKFQIATEDFPLWSGLSNFIGDLNLDLYHVKCESKDNRVLNKYIE